MKKGDVVILGDNFMEECAKYGLHSMPVGILILVGQKVKITGMTGDSLFVQLAGINFSIPASAFMTIKDERRKKIKEIFE